MYDHFCALTSSSDLYGVIGTETDIVAITCEHSVDNTNHSDLISYDKISGVVQDGVRVNRLACVIISLQKYLIHDIATVVGEYADDPLFYVNMTVESKICWRSPVYDLPFEGFPAGPLVVPRHHHLGKLSMSDIHVDIYQKDVAVQVHRRFHYINPMAPYYGDVPAWNLRLSTEGLMPIVAI